MNRVVSREEWLKERIALLEKEKAFNKERDALTRERQALSWVKVDKPYVFEGREGKETLVELFNGCSQLVVYHFMYHPSWGDQPCRSCSYWADNFNGIGIHLKARDVSLVAISKATLWQIKAYRARMGWTFKWVSSHDNDFNADFHVGFSEDDKARNEIYYNYTTTRRAPSAGKNCPAPAYLPGTLRTRCSTPIRPMRGASTCSTAPTTSWTSCRKGGMRASWTGSRRGSVGMTSTEQRSPDGHREEPQ